MNTLCEVFEKGRESNQNEKCEIYLVIFYQVRLQNPLSESQNECIKFSTIAALLINRFHLLSVTEKSNQLMCRLRQKF